MNPLRWRREHQIALAIAAALGGIACVVIGYFVYSVGLGDGAEDFGNWVQAPFSFFLYQYPVYDFASAEWFTFGAIIGGAVVYVGRLLRKSN